jgi:hypothetical protein
MVDSARVHALDGTDQLKHEVTDVLGLEGALAKANGFIEVTIRTELQDEVDVVLGLERLEKIDDVGVRGNA